MLTGCHGKSCSQKLGSLCFEPYTKRTDASKGLGRGRALDACTLVSETPLCLVRSELGLREVHGLSISRVVQVASKDTFLTTAVAQVQGHAGALPPSTCWPGQGRPAVKAAVRTSECCKPPPTPSEPWGSEVSLWERDNLQILMLAWAGLCQPPGLCQGQKEVTQTPSPSRGQGPLPLMSRMTRQTGPHVIFCFSLKPCTEGAPLPLPHGSPGPQQGTASERRDGAFLHSQHSS